ncbi:MAG TPA: S41 family peptidase [Thermoanaerobaculia bacterium]|nr:S41 family peptidase [Thermoanaerobaculia bacterium]HUM29907.1 S41 family peptidase [Thermoanaerobaculia bacterium]HXK68226.1 S41 family peptidase [Thermoanaerobaculia bacterium]
MKLGRNFLLACSLLLVTGLVLSDLVFHSTREKEETYDLLKIFTQAFTITSSQYVEEMQPSDLLRSSMEGLVSSLDGISYYIPSDRIEDFRAYQAMEKRESGIRLARSGNFTYVLSVIKGSPADTSGIRTGDILEQVGHKDTGPLGLWEIESVLAGSGGEEIVLGLVRNDDDEPTQVTLNLTPFTLPVYEDSDHAKLPVLTLYTVNEESVSRALDRLQSLKGTPFILDLRSAVNGSYQSAVDFAGYLGVTDKSVTLQGKKYEPEKISTRVKPVEHGPFVIFVNNSLAGPAELLAGLLQGSDGVTLVGETTAGLVGMQKFIPLKEGGLWVTIASFHIQDTIIHGKGLTPDSPVSSRIHRGPNQEDAYFEKAEEILQATRG